MLYPIEPQAHFLLYYNKPIEKSKVLFLFHIDFLFLFHIDFLCLYKYKQMDCPLGQSIRLKKNHYIGLLTTRGT